MKKRGFTLVELLAVIAILAILVIIALPNVLKMFNDAKKNSFLTETKTIYSEVSKKYISESMKGNKLTYISSEDDTKLEMTGRDLQYCVLLNTDGSVSEMKVSNGTLIATLDKGKKITDLNASNVTEGNLNGYKCGNGSSGGSTVLPTKSFEKETSWEVIASNAKNCVDNPDSCAYEVGQTKTVKMGSFGTHTLRIANLNSPKEEGCGMEVFSESACGFVIEFADIIGTHMMNDTDINKGGWLNSQMKTFINNDIYNSLPQELKSVIITTKTVSGHGSGDTGNFTSPEDKLYLLAPKEIYSDFSNEYDTAADLTRQLDYYKIRGVTTNRKDWNGAIKKDSAGTAKWWWLRSAISYSNYSFLIVDYTGVWSAANGDWCNSNASNACGVSPAFRIG